MFFQNRGNNQKIIVRINLSTSNHIYVFVLRFLCTEMSCQRKMCIFTLLVALTSAIAWCVRTFERETGALLVVLDTLTSESKSARIQGKTGYCIRSLYERPANVLRCIRYWKLLISPRCQSIKEKGSFFAVNSPSGGAKVKQIASRFSPPIVGSLTSHLPAC